MGEPATKFLVLAIEFKFNLDFSILKFNFVYLGNNIKVIEK